MRQCVNCRISERNFLLTNSCWLICCTYCSDGCTRTSGLTISQFEEGRILSKLNYDCFMELLQSTFIFLLMQIDTDKDREQGINKFIKLMKSLTQYFIFHLDYFQKITVINRPYTPVSIHKKSLVCLTVCMTVISNSE